MDAWARATANAALANIVNMPVRIVTVVVVVVVAPAIVELAPAVVSGRGGRQEGDEFDRK